MQVCVLKGCLSQRDFPLNRENPVNEQVRRNRAARKSGNAQ